jgi:hypothetical protein
MTLHNTDPTLYALFCLRRLTLPAHPGSLGRLTGRTASQTALDLLQLEGMGLVQVVDATDAAPVRLTVLGLARSAQLAHASGDSAVLVAEPRKSLRRLKPLLAAKAQHMRAADDQADGTPKALSA